MKGGFSFCGVDIEDLGLTYAPELSNTYVYKPANTKLHETVFDAHDGGYYHGSSIQPKDFVLRCIFEDSYMLDGIMTSIYNVFRRGRTGKLVFKKRPWLWYIATVATDINVQQVTNYQNGVVTITLRAYFPFARTYYTNIDAVYEKDMLNNSALLPEGMTFPTSFATRSDPIQEGKDILLYNPGTERAKVTVRISGDVGNGVSITNKTTGQVCRFVAITEQQVSPNYYVQCDALNGQTIVTNGTVSEPGFLYHDKGFLELEPGYPAYRNINVTIRDNRNIYSNGQFTEDMLGRYIYLSDGSCVKIVNVRDENRIEVNKNVEESQSGNAQILKMNELYISADPKGGEFNITKLEFLFYPTFA